MSNSNSNLLGNGNSPSKRNGNALVPVRESILPASYAFQMKEKFHTAFSQDAGIPLPSSFNLPYWNKTVGEPAWRREVALVAKANKLAHAEYLKNVEEQPLENERRTARNSELMRKHDEQMAAHLQAMAELPERQLRVQAAATEVATRRCIAGLEQAIDSQDAAVAAALDHACHVVNEERRRDTGRFVSTMLWLGLLTLPTVIGSSVCACLAFVASSRSVTSSRKRLAWLLGHYTFYKFGDDTRQPPHTFWLSHEARIDAKTGDVSTPVFVLDSPSPILGSRREKEHGFLGNFESTEFDKDATLLEVVAWILTLGVCAIPGVGLIAARHARSNHDNDLTNLIDRRVKVQDIQQRRKEKLRPIVVHEIARVPFIFNRLVNHSLKECQDLRWQVPPYPSKPNLEPLLAPPERPESRTAQKLESPGWCYDTEERREFSHILKGSLVYDSKQVGTLSRYRIFEGDRVRPYYFLGDVPIRLQTRGRHSLVVGRTGSGKTTTILRLLSSLLPLTRRQVADIVARSENPKERLPASGEEWSRSRTYQAVVFNAKNEYLNFLKAFGFDQDVDLYSFDPTDPLGYAWDVAADIDDRSSIEQFAEQLIPVNLAANRDQGLESWLSNARRAVIAVIISFRNAARAAGKQPDWDLRDLIQAFVTTEKLWNVLAWHDTPDDERARYFELAGPQQSSILVTLREAVGSYGLTANRWRDLKRRGRVISLKHWARRCSNSVLLLPNTLMNVTAYGPLNGAILKALTNCVVQHEYSHCRDHKGKLHVHRRLFVFDEIGHAGPLQSIELLLGLGRDFGVNAVLGLHQLSQLQQTYGDKLADTILGMCSVRAFLKTDDLMTAEWMSKYVGNCLRAYDKTAFTYGTSHTKSFTKTEQATRGSSHGDNRATTKGSSQGISDSAGSSTSHSSSKQSTVTSAPGSRASTTHGESKCVGTGTNKSHTRSQSTQESTTEGSSRQEQESTSASHSNGTTDASNSGQSHSKELRGEAAIEPHEFSRFPEPEEDGVCEAVYIYPSLPIWRTRVGMEEMRPKFEFPERLTDWPVKYTHEEDDRVSRFEAWSEGDLARLGLDEEPELNLLQVPGGNGNIALLNAPENEQRPGEELDELSSEAPADRESEDDQPPQAEFDF